MRHFFPVLAAAISLLAAQPASARDYEVRQLKSKDTADLSSGKSYFFYDTVEGKHDIFFLRSMTPQELEEYSRNRAAALEEARAKLRRKRDGAPGVSDEELLPDAAFGYTDSEIYNLVRLDGGRVYEKGEDHRTYAVEVPPGEYTIFAAGVDGFSGGTCMCLGTVSFVSEAGKITDLGTILVAHENGKTEIPELRPFEAPEYIRRKAVPAIMSVRQPEDGDAVPALFAGMDIVHVEYRAADKIPNFLGMLINRMPPIDGILAYELDRIVDLRATEDSATVEAGTEMLASVQDSAIAVDEPLNDGMATWGLQLDDDTKEPSTGLTEESGGMPLAVAD